MKNQLLKQIRSAFVDFTDRASESGYGVREDFWPPLSCFPVVNISTKRAGVITAKASLRINQPDMKKKSFPNIEILKANQPVVLCFRLPIEEWRRYRE